MTYVFEDIFDCRFSKSIVERNIAYILIVAADDCQIIFVTVRRVNGDLAFATDESVLFQRISKILGGRAKFTVCPRSVTFQRDFDSSTCTRVQNPCCGIVAELNLPLGLRLRFVIFEDRYPLRPN